MKVISFLLGFISIQRVKASGGCRNLDFLDCIRDKTLVNHTVETSRVLCPGLEQCQHKCFMNDACVSYNLGPIEGMIRTCELSGIDHVGHPNHVVPKEGSEYCAIKNSCSSKPCADNQICRPDFSWDSFVCFDTCASNSCPTYRNCNQDPSTLSLSCTGLSSTCTEALGMEDGKIPDSAITASSIHALFTHDAYRGRLRHQAVAGRFQSAWSAKDNKVGEYLQVDLGRALYVTKVATQGRNHLTLSQWVTSYSLQYGLDGRKLDDYKTSNVPKIFTGNRDKETVVRHTLVLPFKAQFVRIVVQSWSSHISMRAELYGCQA